MTPKPDGFPPRCGRETASTKKPCRGFRLDPYPSCVTHLTPEECRDYERRKAEQNAFWAPFLQKRANLIAGQPSCWSWPVERSHSARALESVAANDLRLSEELADEVLEEWHAGRCAICGRSDALVMDHDHATGLVRGRLCRQCNTNEGLDGRIGTVYQRYRELPPTLILGVRLRYWDPYLRKYAEPARDEDDGLGERNPLTNIGL